MARSKACSLPPQFNPGFKDVQPLFKQHLEFNLKLKRKGLKGFFHQCFSLVLKNIFQCGVIECYLHLSKLRC